MGASATAFTAPWAVSTVMRLNRMWPTTSPFISATSESRMAFFGPQLVNQIGFVGAAKSRFGHLANAFAIAGMLRSDERMWFVGHRESAAKIGDGFDR